eukprot:14306.XXX_1086892_1087050_1 [CDS] Oithona nana genome sequencing.
MKAKVHTVTICFRFSSPFCTLQLYYCIQESKGDINAAVSCSCTLCQTKRRGE